MAGFGKILKAFAGGLADRRGVSAAEYAILAVGIVIVVGGALVTLDLRAPLLYASSALTSGQGSLAVGAR